MDQSIGERKTLISNRMEHKPSDDRPGWITGIAMYLPQAVLFSGLVMYQGSHGESDFAFFPYLGMLQVVVLGFLSVRYPAFAGLYFKTAIATWLATPIFWMILAIIAMGGHY